MAKETTACNKEHELLKRSLELFEAYAKDLETSRPVATEDLRIAVYALDLIFDECLIHHPTVRSVFETLQRQLLDLRFFIDQKLEESRMTKILTWKIFELNEVLRASLSIAQTLVSPQDLPQGLQRDSTKDYLQTPRMIIDRLRSVRGLTAA